MSEIPKIKSLQDGIISCYGCKSNIHFLDYEPLEVINCHKCNAPIFIPMKINFFWIYKPLGGGGMGSVYLAISEDQKGEFAIKILPRAKKKDQLLISTLNKEGEVGEILGKAPNIAEIVDYGFSDDEHFLVSRYVEGSRLDLYISTSSHLSERQSIDILLQIVEAEIHIVKCGFLFRDIKPENIIVVEKDGVVKLFDFGLTLSLEASANPNPDDPLEGSPYYLPPERIVANPEGEYSEIYSLGMLLFQMLSGSTYFSKSDVRDLLSKHIRSLRVASVRTRLKHCSDEIISLLDFMIKRDPNERMQDLGTLKTELQKLKDSASGYPLSSSNSKESKSKSSNTTKKRSKSKPIFLLSILFLTSIAVGYWHYINIYSKKENEKKVLISIANKMNISPGIQPPKISKDQIIKKISEKGELLLAKKVGALKPFDNHSEIIKICKQLSIPSSMRKRPLFNLSELNKMIDKQIEVKTINYLEKNKKIYNKNDAAKRLAKEMNLTLPIKSPTKSLKSIKSEILKEAITKSKAKYSSKSLSKEIMKIMKKYRAYRKGARVNVMRQSGEKISGIYSGREGNKILIGTHKVMISDLPGDERLKFNSALSAKRASFVIKKVRNNFSLKRKSFAKKYALSKEKELYSKYGYSSINNKWLANSAIFNDKMSKLYKKSNSNQRLMKDRIKRKIKKEFNSDKFIRSYGYCKSKGKWYSEKNIIDILLKKRKVLFDQKREKEVAIYKKEIEEKIEPDIYKENGYIKVDEEWIPAYDNLHKSAKKALQ